MIVAAMIVGAGESVRYLDRTLRLARTWADRIIALSDHADRDTVRALRDRCDWVVQSHRGDEFDESLIRNQLLAYLDERLPPGAIVVMLDADEELQTLAGINPRGVLHSYRATPYDAWLVRFFHLWAPDGRHYRTDGAWAPSDGHRVYRHEPGRRIALAKALGCPPVPAAAWQMAPTVELRCLHWGYARPHDRPVKHERYIRLDGGRFHARSHLDSIIAEPTIADLEAPA